MTDAIGNYQEWMAPYPKGSYPSSVDELFEFAGEPNWEAWIAPLTSVSVRVTDTWDGTNVVNRALNEGRGYEILVPLFGAGSEEVVKPDAIDWNNLAQPWYGYYPGKYMRSSRGTGENDFRFTLVL